MGKAIKARTNGKLNKGHRPPVPENRRCKGKVRSTGNRCSKAAIKGGPVCDTHNGRLPNVKAAAKRRIREYVADMVDPDRVLQEAARLAMADITQIYDENYKIRPVKDWPVGLRQAVKRMEPRTANMDPHDGASDKVLRVELHDKVKPLEMLAKHLGLFEEKVRVDANVTYKWAGE